MAGLPPDYHTHTARCGHASGTAHDYVESARRLGLSGVGISDHLPHLEGRDPQLAMAASDLDAYVAEVNELKRRHPGFVLLGGEADYRPEQLDRLPDLLSSQPFDYIIGSVHHLDGWGFDDPRLQDQWEGRDVDEVYRRYLELVGDAAESGLFTILGHLDLVKKFGHRPSVSLEPEVERLAERLARSGVAVEINTAGLRKPIREIYPSAAILRVLAAHRVPVTFGSDAHRPEEVGRDFDKALELARSTGYQEYVVLHGTRKPEGRTNSRPVPLLPPDRP